MNMTLKQALKKTKKSKCSICLQPIAGDVAAHTKACWHSEKACAIMEQLKKNNGSEPYFQKDLSKMQKKIFKLQEHITEVRANIQPHQDVYIY